MKPGHLIVLIATVTVFLATFLISNGLPTGFVTFEQQPINLEIGDVQVYDTKATIRWATDAKTASVLGINGKQITFQAAKEFGKEITGLEPSASYDYTIRACNAYACEEKKSAIITKNAPVENKAPVIAITGAAPGVEALQTLQASIKYLLYGLIGAIALILTGKIGYERLSSRNQMPRIVSRAKRLIDNEEYDKAGQAYSEARKAFSELEEAAKLKHYNELLQIYHSLKKQAEIQEAQRLTEKYSEGNITQDELRRLNELIAN